MTLFIGSFGVISIIFGLIFSLSVLSSKPLISQAFFTDEQKLKVYLYNLIMFSVFLSITGVILFIIWNTSLSADQAELDPQVLGQGLGIAIVTFMSSVFVADRIANLIQNFRIKYHYKLLVNVPTVGSVYIIGMLDRETCICSKDPNLSFRGSKSTKSTYLIPKEDIMKLPLTITKQTKPKKTFFEKFTA